MRAPPRRLTLQLVSLFDLLMIVIFAQYMDVQATARHQADKATRELTAAREKMAEAETKRVTEDRFLAEGAEIKKLLGKDLERITTENEMLRADAERKQAELKSELKQAREDLVRVGDFVSELFHLPEDVRARILKVRSAAEAAQIREALRELASTRGSDMVRHVLTLDELHKRCDVWELQVDDTNVTTFTAGKVKGRFRAATAEQFAGELFKRYKNLPQPKSMVIILLSWSDAELRARAAAIEGLEKATEKMRIDSDRRTRFEYGVLGYIPSQRL